MVNDAIASRPRPFYCSDYDCHVAQCRPPRSSYVEARAMHVYEVSAVGLAGEIVRPISLRIQDQAGVVLPYLGGYETAAVENVRFSGLVSARSVHSIVAGSNDAKRDTDTALASTVIEDLNICDVVTAERIVARLSAYRPTGVTETRFSLTGTQFVNLRIAGEPVQAGLAIEVFNRAGTFSDLAKRHATGELRDFVHGSRLEEPKTKEYGFPGLEALYQEQLRFRKQMTGDPPSRFSLANRVEVKGGLQAFGSIIIVPDFGVIHLAEFFITQRQRRLSMLRLELGCPIEGKLLVATSSAGDTTDSTGPR